MNIDIKTADGEEIELGGAYYDGRGTEYRPVGIRLVDYHRIIELSPSCLTGKVDKLCCVSMRPDELYSTPPDSWEKLEEDLRRGAGALNYEACAYFGKSAGDCSSCIADKGETCERVVMRDIADRVHKLGGEGDA